MWQYVQIYRREEMIMVRMVVGKWKGDFRSQKKLKYLIKLNIGSVAWS
jgi:hypothetical protein